MEENFKRSLAAVLQSEGGNDDDPADHGGRTSRGITQREYDAWRREKGLMPQDVWKADDQDVAMIYHDEYWRPECDELPTGIDYLVFDMKVNAGPHQAIVLLQRALGVNPDGRFGPVSRQAARNSDPIGLVEKYSIAKVNFYRSLHQPKFLRGWLNRVRDVRTTALQMIGKLK